VSLSRYPTYKCSAIPWLKELPEHWGVCPLKSLLSIENGLDHKEVVSDEGWPVFGSGGPFAQASNYLYDGETILLGRKGTIDKPLYYSGKFWAVDTMYWSKVKPGCVGRFVYFSCLSIPFSYYQTSTALPSMTKSSLGSHPVCLPPAEEQLVIASFLDRETAKIDDLIAEQQRLIELLQEKRQAVISHAVTKGLHPDAPMKDSGVEWLGEVPEHWSVCSFRRLVRIAEGQVDPRIYPYSVMPLIAPNHILSGTGVVVSLETAAEQGAESGKYICEKGAVIYSKIRPSLRKACIAPEDCLTSADMYPLQAMEGLIPEFLLYFLLSEQFSALAVVESERVAMPKVHNGWSECRNASGLTLLHL